MCLFVGLFFLFCSLLLLLFFPFLYSLFSIFYFVTIAIYSKFLFHHLPFWCISKPQTLRSLCLALSSVASDPLPSYAFLFPRSLLSFVSISFLFSLANSIVPALSKCRFYSPVCFVLDFSCFLFHLPFMYSAFLFCLLSYYALIMR